MNYDEDIEEGLERDICPPYTNEEAIQEYLNEEDNPSATLLIVTPYTEDK